MKYKSKLSWDLSGFNRLGFKVNPFESVYCKIVIRLPHARTLHLIVVS